MPVLVDGTRPSLSQANDLPSIPAILTGRCAHRRDSPESTSKARACRAIRCTKRGGCNTMTQTNKTSPFLPGITMHRRPIAGGMVYEFEHEQLGPLGRLSSLPHSPGQTQIAIDRPRLPLIPRVTRMIPSGQSSMRNSRRLGIWQGFVPETAICAAQIADTSSASVVE